MKRLCSITPPLIQLYKRTKIYKMCSMFALCLLIPFITSSPALAQSASPGTIQLDEVVVIGQRIELAERIDALPGGADLLSTHDLARTANLTVSRALAAAPGVVIQDFFGGNDQPRIQIRGSGLQQNPVERGVLVLHNGLPINRADGSYAVGLANPSHVEAIEIYRGHLANRLGATVLGGAINFIGPSGRTAPGGKLELSAGSFDQANIFGQYGWTVNGSGNESDMLVHADVSHRDGYRDYNESRRVHLGANGGIRLGDHVNIRVFADYTDLGFDVSGPLTADLLKSNPEAVFTGPTVTPAGAINPGPNVVRDRPRRDVEQFLAGSRATVTTGYHVFDFALGYTWSDDSFRFPISAGIRTTDSKDLTTVMRYAFMPNRASELPLFEATAQYASGSADRDYYLNLAGEKGAQFGANKLDADTLSLSASLHIPFNETWSVSPSVSFASAKRKNFDIYTDTYALSTRPTAAYSPINPAFALPNGFVPADSTRYKRKYEGWSPALGISWRIRPKQRVFAALSRSFEPPTHDDLLATINGTPNSSAGRPNPGNPMLPAAVFATPDLAAQEATTLETGWRGQQGKFSWDASTYYSWVEDELLSLRDSSGASLGAVNANKTRHFGIELGLKAQLTSRLEGRVVYTFQDFRFRDDPVRGNNRLAGAPRHWFYASADYSFYQSWTVGANIRWMMSKTPVDNMNTIFNDAYFVLDLRTECEITESISLFGEITNVFDENYASSTLIVDQARPDQAVYLPGDGRGLFVGARWLF